LQSNVSEATVVELHAFGSDSDDWPHGPADVPKDRYPSGVELVRGNSQRSRRHRHVAVQLAKYFGAAQVITAATGPGINMVSSLGADVVTDYRVTDMFDTLADDSVDVVCDNLGYAGTADKAMRVIRPGGAYILLPTGHGGTLSNSTKDVTQINFGYMQPNSFDLSTLASLFDDGTLQTKNMQSFNIADAPLGFTRKTSGNVLSKISVAVALEDSVEQTKSVRSSLTRRRASEVV